jgi:transcriptional regulator with GAF, ATPase, and Fis domain
MADDFPRGVSHGFPHEAGEAAGAFQATAAPPPLETMLDVFGRRQDGAVTSVTPHLAHQPLQDRGAVVATFDNTTLPLHMARELDERSAFERAVADIAARFAAVDIGDLDDRIVESQRQLCGLLEVDRSWLWEPHGDLFTCTHLWSRDDIQAPVPLPDALEAREHLPWLLSQVEAGHIIAVSRVDDVPSAPDRESLRRIGTQSTITVPLSVGSKLIGILSFGTLRSERTWSGYTLEGLKLIAAVMANGLARHQATQALRSALDEVRRLRARLAPEHVQMRREVKAMKLPRQVAVDSASVRHLMEQVEQVAPTTATVLLMGETGSGKEVFAEAIHELSPRRHKPMVRLNCAAIPVSLIESELFGRERGAYTGALSRQAGRFEIADGSTIFLDEIGELPLDVQVKLLRVLQERTVERLGSSHPIKVNVRVIAATNRNLEQAVADKTFREDLYYRLNVFPLRVPPLRERVQDIPSLAWTFIDEFAGAFGKSIESLSKASLEALQRYSWPGNVRELRNVIERAVIIANSPTLVVELPQPTAATRRKSLKFVDVETEHIRSVLESTGGRIRGSGGAAELLGLKPTTLESRMTRLGISRSGPTAPHARATTGGPRTFAVG